MIDPTSLMLRSPPAAQMSSPAGILFPLLLCPCIEQSLPATAVNGKSTASFGCMDCMNSFSAPKPLVPQSSSSA